jgi:hypothetical protein
MNSTGKTSHLAAVSTVNDTENRARQLMAVIGTHRSVNARFV